MAESGFPWHLVPPLCLLAGLIIGLGGLNPFGPQTRTLGRISLQISIVLLGLTIPLADVLKAGTSGLALTMAGLLAVGGAGAWLAPRLGVAPRLAALVTVGTAVCGGSAIAAAAPLTGASDDEIAASLATVFVLNGLALFLFPWLGHGLWLDAPTFAAWAAIAIHDTSSVVGAAMAFDRASVATATTIKLARTLWILPVCLLLAARFRQKVALDLRAGQASSLALVRRVSRWIPWFLPAFMIAALIRSLVGPGDWTTVVGHGARTGLGLSLLCIGAGVTPKTLLGLSRQALVLGVLLWLLAATLGLALAHAIRFESA